ncbi:hypothetical protein AA471_11115 [Salmonella enterica subsp. enterica]|nr:hypothetical protein [Salmonella enterica subsp. enterica]EDQ2988614.1 hypothetical protein [Salmonella enterica subsp. enterica]
MSVINTIINTLLTMFVFYSGVLAIFAWKKRSNKRLKFGDMRREYEAALAKGMFPMLLATLAYMFVFWLIR